MTVSKPRYSAQYALMNSSIMDCMAQIRMSRNSIFRQLKDNSDKKYYGGIYKLDYMDVFINHQIVKITYLIRSCMTNDYRYILKESGINYDRNR